MMITPAAAFYELFSKTVLISCHHFMILDFFSKLQVNFSTGECVQFIFSQNVALKGSQKP